MVLLDATTRESASGGATCTPPGETRNIHPDRYSIKILRDANICYLTVIACSLPGRNGLAPRQRSRGGMPATIRQPAAAGRLKVPQCDAARRSCGARRRSCSRRFSFKFNPHRDRWEGSPGVLKYRRRAPETRLGDRFCHKGDRSENTPLRSSGDKRRSSGDLAAAARSTRAAPPAGDPCRADRTREDCQAARLGHQAQLVDLRLE